VFRMSPFEELKTILVQEFDELLVVAAAVV
jgi:hypothetical protein